MSQTHNRETRIVDATTDIEWKEEASDQTQPSPTGDESLAGEELDEELDSLLDSAEKDFKETPTLARCSSDATGPQSRGQVSGGQASGGQASGGQPGESSSKHDDTSSASDTLTFDPASLSGSDMDAQIRQILGGDQQLLEGFQNFTRAAEPAATGASSNPQSFADTLNQTLNSLGESAESLKNSEFDEEAFVRALEGSMNIDPTTDGDQTADFLPMMQNMMHSLLSKDVLYPSLKDMADKYPSWLTSHRDSTPKSQFDKYALQFDIVSQLIDEYDAERSNEAAMVKDQRFERILELMTKMQDCGPPPKEIVSSLAPGLNFDSQGNPVMPGLPSVDQQCPVM